MVAAGAGVAAGGRRGGRRGRSGHRRGAPRERLERAKGGSEFRTPSLYLLQWSGIESYSISHLVVQARTLSLLDPF